MNRCFLYLIFIMLSVITVWGDRLLEADEADALLKQITQSPKRQWLTQGTIQTRRLEYYDHENKVKESTETVYYDGTRMRLDVLTNDEQSTNIANRMDQDALLNKKRIFLWSNNQYVEYYESADYAVVSSTTDTPPVASRGPLTAGIIPWGHGDFTYLVLASQNPAIYEQFDEGQQRFSIEYTNTSTTPDIQVSITLDPSKDNAVLSYRIENEMALLKQTYQDYQRIEDRWIPGKILIERFDKRSGNMKLLSYEDWKFDLIDTTTPSEDIFILKYKNGTTVELNPGDDIKTFLYNASDHIDISEILAEKINLLQADQDTVNCATAAIKHIVHRFSKELEQDNLTSVIAADTRKTTLYDIKKTLEEAGLNCMAVTTDLETLRKIENCVTILHLNLSNHYIILDRVDKDSVWIIDLTSRKFFTKRKIDDLMTEWNSGTALVVSDQVITPPLDGSLEYLGTDEMTRILGGDFGTYSCSNKIQEYEHVLCSEPIGGFLCGGAYYVFMTRYGCQEDEKGGICTGSKMLSYRYSQCLNDPYLQGSCMITGTWTSRYVRACQ